MEILKNIFTLVNIMGAYAAIGLFILIFITPYSFFTKRWDIWKKAWYYLTFAIFLGILVPVLWILGMLIIPPFLHAMQGAGIAGYLEFLGLLIIILVGIFAFVVFSSHKRQIFREESVQEIRSLLFGNAKNLIIIFAFGVALIAAALLINKIMGSQLI